jgi:hypothetical protein
MQPTHLIFLVFLFALFGWPIIVGHKLGKRRNRIGWLYGLLLGWLGVVILACLSPAADPALAEKERRVRELELDARIAALEQNK